MSNLPGWRTAGSAENEGVGWDWQFQGLGMLPAGWVFDGGRKPIGYQKSCLPWLQHFTLWKCFHFPSSFNPLNHLMRQEDRLSLLSLLGFLSMNELYASTFMVFVFSSWISSLHHLHCFFLFLGHRLHVIFLQDSILSPVSFSLFGN